MSAEAPITPCGIQLAIGQCWQEMDNRFKDFPRTIIVRGWEENRVLIEGFVKTRAKLSRFHGKNGGYRYLHA